MADRDDLVAALDEELGLAPEDFDLEDDLEADAPGPSPMDEGDFQAFIRAEVEDAELYLEEYLATPRSAATKAYFGDPYGDEEEGRSQIVSRDLHDTVRGILPSLLRIFFGSERAVEFQPRGPEDVRLAEQQTDYVNAIVVQGDNDGFGTFYSVFKDALIRKAGIVKLWWQSDVDTDVLSYSGLTPEAVALMAQSPEVEVLSVSGDPLLDVTIRRTRDRSRVRFEAVPPEEFVIDRYARSLDDATLVGHQREVTRGELVAMGFDWETADRVGSGKHGASTRLTTSLERQARAPQETITSRHRGTRGAEDIIMLSELYVRCDYDGDGVEELRRVIVAGADFEVLENLEWDEVPFCCWQPDPEPHMFFGLGLYDLVGDIQRIKTAITRGVLDSLGESIDPATVVVEGQVRMEDVLSPKTGRVIRARAPGMVQPLPQPFVGAAALPVLEYMDQVKAARTGQTPESQGLNAQALQSTTRAAVAATVSAAQAQIEMIARIFAEVGFKPFYRKILRLLTRHQDVQRTVRLRNEWVTVDPTDWDATMDVSINVALGAGLPEDRVQLLNAVAQKQEAILQAAGPSNPLVGYGEYRSTLAKLLELGGIKDTQKYLKPVPPGWEPPPPPPPPPDPAAIIAQAEVQKVQANTQLKQLELQLEDDRERDKLEVDATLKLAELKAKYDKVDADVTIAQIRARSQNSRNDG